MYTIVLQNISGFFVVVFVVFVVDCSYTGSENVHFNSLKTDDNVGNY